MECGTKDTLSDRQHYSWRTVLSANFFHRESARLIPKNKYGPGQPPGPYRFGGCPSQLQRGRHRADCLLKVCRLSPDSVSDQEPHPSTGARERKAQSLSAGYQPTGPMNPRFSPGETGLFRSRNARVHRVDPPAISTLENCREPLTHLRRASKL